MLVVHFLCFCTECRGLLVSFCPPFLPFLAERPVVRHDVRPHGVSEYGLCGAQSTVLWLVSKLDSFTKSVRVQATVFRRLCQKSLDGFDSCLRRAVRLWMMGTAEFVKDPPLTTKVLELARTELWPAVRGQSNWNTLLCEPIL